MQVQVPYGEHDRVDIHLADEHVAGVIYPNRVGSADERQTLERALNHPLGSRPFDEFLRDARDILVVVNDATRPTPTAKVLDAIISKLDGIPVRFLVATGSHREPTDEEYRQIFGGFYEEFHGQIIVHNARRQENMVALETTTRGTQMAINRLALEADKILVIGSVEPHYFAGFTGGRKSFLPGIASYQAIEHNHRFALQREACTLALEGNPVHEDMVEAIQPLLDREIFAIMTLVTTDGAIHGCTAGDIESSFYPATEKSKEIFAVKVPERTDVVVAVAPFPTDINLFQSQKALENGKLALKDGGILILVSKCRSGVGDDTFVRLLSGSQTPQDALHKIEREYQLGYHKAAKIAEISQWAQIWAVTELDDSILQGVFIKPYGDLQDAIDGALAEKGPGAKVLFLMAGSLTVPMVSGS